MRQILFWASAITISSTLVDAIAASPTFQSQQVAQSSENCRGRQILTVSNCPGDGLESEEARLYQLINQYRSQNGLPPIPFSKSLTLVANRHVRDLEENIGELTHGWSDCPYDENNENTWPCMWEAPQRLRTAYLGRGYENAHGGSRGYRASAASALQSWQGSSPHNAVILNQGIWQNSQWNSLGIGIYKGYAVLWFGEEPDSANTSATVSDRSPTQFNLSGQWVIKTQNYRVGEDGITCIPEPNTELTIEPIITQNGNQIDADPMTLIINEGSISGNSVYIRGEIFSLKGTIGNDGNQITGTFTCSPLTQPFTMTRKNSQSSGNTPQQPIQVPSDNQPPNSNQSEMLW